jgi:hypothetical protein
MHDESADQHIAFDKRPAQLALDRSIAALMNHESPANRAAYYHALLLADLLLPMGAPAETHARIELTASSGAEPRPIDSDHSLVLVRGPGGERGVLAFTTMSSVHRWFDRPVECVTIAAGALMQVIRDHKIEAILLNPGAEHGLEISIEEAELLAEGVIPIAADHNEHAAILAGADQFRIDAPQSPMPQDALAYLVGVLSGFPEVEAAYYVSAHSGNQFLGDALGLAVFPRTSDAAARTAVQDIGPRLAGAFGGDSGVDVFLLSEVSLRTRAAKLGQRVYPVGSA